MNCYLDRPEVETANQPTNGLYVLVVEDHEETAVATAMLLRQCGYEVRVALDGPTAVQAAREGQPDVILLDIGLPGIDGYGVARWIREQRTEKRPLLVAVTGHGGDGDRSQSAEAGIDLHLVKPVDPAHLQWLLQRFRTVVE